MAEHISYPQGILPFNSGDSSIVVEASCLTEASITGVGGVLRTDTTIDPVNGITGSTDGFFYIDLGAGYYSRLNEAGQLSFEIPWRHICAANAGNPRDHGGIEHPLNLAHVFSANSLRTTNQPYMFFGVGVGESTENLASDGCLFEMSSNTDVWTKQIIGENTCKANGDFATVTFSWHDNFLHLIINGVWINSGVVSTDRINKVDGMRYLCFGSTPAGTLPVLSGATIRNVRLSTRMASKPQVPPLLTKVAWIGDSLASQNLTDITLFNSLSVDPYKSSASFAMEHELAKHGVGINSDFTQAVAGSVIDDAAANPIIDQIAPVLALNPTIVCYRGGTNDRSKVTADTETSIRGHLTTLLNYHSVQYVVVGTIPSVENDPAESGAAKQAKVDELNVVLNALPTWAAANGFTGRVLIADCFTRFGGHDVITDWFQTDNLHPGSFGKWQLGKVYAEQIVKLLG